MQARQLLSSCHSHPTISTTKIVRTAFSLMFMSKGSTQRAAEIRNIFIMSLVGLCGRRGGFMVSALDSSARGPGSSPGRGHCVVSSLHQVCKWVPANLMLGVTLGWTSIPSREGGGE